MEIVPADPEAPESRTLLGAFSAEIDALCAAEGGMEATPPVDGAEMRPPRGAFMVIRASGRAVACGGLRDLGDGAGEVKRLYVLPEARRQGHARTLLDALEETARRIGHTRLRLDTAARLPGTRALFAAAGYREIPDYNGNRLATAWFEKTLA